MTFSADTAISHYAAVRRRLYQTRRAEPDAAEILPCAVAAVLAAPVPEQESIPAFAIPTAEQQVIFDQIAAIRHPSRDIIQAIAADHKFSIHAVKSSRRNALLVRCRHECCYRLYAETALSLPQIGRCLGGRDHTTILHGIRRHAKLKGLDLPRGLTWGRSR